jgi:hypothetical protein
MRFPLPKRIVVVFVLVPIFTMLIIFNRIFLWLDYLIFPKFLKQRIQNPVFIVAAPRSATTFVYQGLANTGDFTCFKLWEIIFAPSICQKYFFLNLFKLDRKLNNRLKKSILWLEEVFFGKFKRIHLIGLNLPEEDEAIMLWSLKTFYFSFFYSDAGIFDDYALFDQAIAEEKRIKIMNSYKKYIQRHMYVFNRGESLRFLSKNPMLMPKFNSLSKLFPDAQIVNINRCPAEVIPSAISLSQNLFGFFTSKSMSQEMIEKITNVLIAWYQNFEKNLPLVSNARCIKISFLKIINQDPSELERLANFLSLSKVKLEWKKNEMTKTHKSSNSYSKLTDQELEKILTVIPFMRDSCK